MKALEELTQEIREKLPRLKESNKYQRLGGLDIITVNSIMLNDVLEWLNKTKEYSKSPNAFAFDCHGNIFRINPATDELWDYGPKWDLSKPFLKDQSPELINFLHGLTTKKQNNDKRTENTRSLRL